MEVIGSRKRNQPAPPPIIFEDLCEPHRQPVRPWLQPLTDEIEPVVVERHEYDLVVWSSLWVKRPDARAQFDLEASGSGSDLRWTLYIEQPAPDAGLIEHMRKRIGELINANLRYTYGQ